jgi:ribosomal protein S18 acetylase RimI-like enzyme
VSLRASSRLPMTEILPFTPSDYDEVMTLWKATEGLTLREADSRQAIINYLGHNPGLSFVARDGDRLVGAVLAGTDGRRGYLQHLAVAATHRRRGLGSSLAIRVLVELRAVGIAKCHLFVRREHADAREFWEHLGWTARDDVVLMSYLDSDTANP